MNSLKYLEPLRSYENGGSVNVTKFLSECKERYNIWQGTQDLDFWEFVMKKAIRNRIANLPATQRKSFYNGKNTYTSAPIFLEFCRFISVDLKQHIDAVYQEILKEESDEEN